ncbi:drug/metabolite transporter [Massilia aurea]|uniref:Drug/metabolite transporter n=1 Tax=Massilia aurea TaxID=373040 RepID=A0A422QDW9_9BURK|nr:DMT family transporter [Massilia aurea]RNF28222.1 drug/metabolite transporter [Massilia aurea]
MTASSILKPIIAAPSSTLPFLFILMWSSGYVVGKLALPYAGPFTLLFLRFALAALVLLAIALLTRAPWPTGWKPAAHLVVVGLLMQALQFSSLYTGLKLGVSAGVSALIVGTMPLFTALGASVLLHERVNGRQWLGLAAGLGGVALVVADRIGGATLAGLGAVSLALVGITLSTLYQKKYCSNADLRTGGCIQLTVAGIVALPLALWFEGFEVRWGMELLLASGWLSVVNSIGAVSLLFLMMRTGEASKVASLFYLVPGTTALMGFAVLGETPGAMTLAGFMVTAGAVYVCTRQRRIRCTGR